jgi:hypothetical protein
MAVAAVMNDVLSGLGFSQSIPLLYRVLGDVAKLFTGKWPGFQAIDMVYHDFEHTLEVTVCALKIIQGNALTSNVIRLTQTDCEILIAASLLHDSGFLKPTYDTLGTGAKYTLIHERLGSTFARTYLTELTMPQTDIFDVTSAIKCTGPGNRIGRAEFARPMARTIAAMLVTADYLGQMASASYVRKLPFLYREFEEAYDYAQIPETERVFKSAANLIRQTPGFWRNFVFPMLDAELDGVYQCILPLEDGRNPYIAAVERNVAQVALLATAPDISLDPFGPRSSPQQVSVR